MKNKIKIIISIIILLIALDLYSERLSFVVEYLGLNVATVEMIFSIEEIDINLMPDIENSHSVNKIITTASSSKFIDFFTHSFENTYVSYSDQEFRTILYKKDIKQKNFQEMADTIYDFERLEANYFEQLSERSHRYLILKDTRDFFSALYYLRQVDIKKNQNLSLDVAGKIVLITTKYLGSENLRTNIGRVQADKIEISFQWYDGTRKMRSDILTNNLWFEGNKLIFWFTDDDRKIPVKAQYIMKPFNVNWNIRG